MSKQQSVGQSNFEVVARGPTANSDDESDGEQAPLEYDSEEYNTDERATHVAVGALMTRPSRKRKLLDAAYNRYAFNDDTLPDWFAEDESRHNRPQIPVTKEMVDAIKARYKDLAAKPTHKVAEARARKKRRLVQKIDGIKRKASAIAEQVRFVCMFAFVLVLLCVFLYISNRFLPHSPCLYLQLWSLSRAALLRLRWAVLVPK
jgi:AdoMet-dependent rRNA methyltransferase SPB1